MAKVNTEYTKETAWIAIWYECTGCKFDGIHKEFTYCPNCGERIDWK